MSIPKMLFEKYDRDLERLSYFRKWGETIKMNAWKQAQYFFVDKSKTLQDPFDYVSCLSHFNANYI